MCVFVSMTCDSIFTIVLYSNDHEHMITAEISLNGNPLGLKGKENGKTIMRAPISYTLYY